MLAGRRRQSGLAHGADRIGAAHVERIVAADHHVVGAELLDQEPEVRRAEGERVEVEQPRVVARLPRDGRRPFGSHPPAVIESGQQAFQKTWKPEWQGAGFISDADKAGFITQRGAIANELRKTLPDLKDEELGDIPSESTLRSKYLELDKQKFAHLKEVDKQKMSNAAANIKIALAKLADQLNRTKLMGQHVSISQFNAMTGDWNASMRQFELAAKGVTGKGTLGDINDKIERAQAEYQANPTDANKAKIAGLQTTRDQINKKLLEGMGIPSSMTGLYNFMGIEPDPNQTFVPPPARGEGEFPPHGFGPPPSKPSQQKGMKTLKPHSTQKAGYKLPAGWH